jgi:hypothetical protein
MLLGLLERRAALAAGDDCGDGLGGWPVCVKKEKGAEGETEKQESCD